MMQKNVRLCSAELFDYKNVAHGKIEMPSAAKRDFSCDRAEILGIYGQNGSGKTTVIEALSLAKFLLSGEALPQDAADDIAKNADAAACALSFFIGDENEGVIAEYFFLMRRADSVEQRVYIAEEKLSYRAVTAGKASAAK